MAMLRLNLFYFILFIVFLLISFNGTEGNGRMVRILQQVPDPAPKCLKSGEQCTFTLLPCCSGFCQINFGLGLDKCV
ncbi:unnamed protein product [Amaranthus hypochondriacus]